MIRLGGVFFTTALFALCARIEQPWTWLDWVALLPWLFSLERERSLRAALGSGVLLSIAFSVAVFSWLPPAVTRYTSIPLAVTYPLLALVGPFLQPQFVAFAGTRWLLRGGTPVASAIAAALVWAGVEWAFPRLFEDSLGHGLFPVAALRQGADVAGVLGLTFAIVLVNQLTYEAWARRRDARTDAIRAATVAIVLLVSLAMYGSFRLTQWSATEGASFTTVLVQANLSDYDQLRDELGSYDAVDLILDQHERLTRQALETVDTVDLIIWPETVYPTTFGTPKSGAGAELDDRLRAFASSTGVPLLFGTYDSDARGEYNAAVLLRPNGRFERESDVYRKRRPFPLTEAVPTWMDSDTLRSALPWLGTWRPGLGPTTFEVRDRRGRRTVLAPLICLDAVAPDLALDGAREGAAALVVLSNDGWFSGGAGARLHLVVSAFRSIETRLPQVRATNTGITAAIDATGEILASIEIDRSEALVATIHPRGSNRTPMIRWGPWLGPTALALGPLIGALAIRRRRRRR